jgi:hypothetical protein
MTASDSRNPFMYRKNKISFLLRNSGNENPVDLLAAELRKGLTRSGSQPNSGTTKCPC